MTTTTKLERLRLAARDIARYALSSGVVFAVNTLVYILYFLATKPKYTFLTGNSLLGFLGVVEVVAIFGWTMLRPAEAQVERFRWAVASTFTGILLLYGLHATVFTIVERSVSINVLRYLVNEGKQPYPKIEQNFVSTFVMRDKAVCKRLDEQMRLGNVVLEDGNYSVTPKGLRTFGMLDKVTLVTAADRPENLPSCQ